MLRNLHNCFNMSYIEIINCTKHHYIFYFELSQWRVCFRFNFLLRAVFGYIIMLAPRVGVPLSHSHTWTWAAAGERFLCTPRSSVRKTSSIIKALQIVYWVRCATMASAISSTYWYTAAEREVTAPVREPQLQSRSARVHFTAVVHVRLTRKNECDDCGCFVLRFLWICCRRRWTATSRFEFLFKIYTI